jgi:hypothetical protein
VAQPGEQPKTRVPQLAPQQVGIRHLRRSAPQRPVGHDGAAETQRADQRRRGVAPEAEGVPNCVKTRCFMAGSRRSNVIYLALVSAIRKRSTYSLGTGRCP